MKENTTREATNKIVNNFFIKFPFYFDTLLFEAIKILKQGIFSHFAIFIEIFFDLRGFCKSKKHEH